MSDPLVRLQRLVDRAVDGERLTATELAAVAPLFVDAAALDQASLVEALGACAHPEGRLPAGQLVLGPAADPQVTWACAPDAVAEVLARVAQAVALLHHALAAGWLEPVATGLGLDPAVLRTLAEGTSLCVRPPHLEVAPLLPASRRWHLLIVQDLPVVDVVAPYLRDVAGCVETFAATQGLPLDDDDAPYAALDRLLASDPRLAAERAAQEAGHGVVRGAAGLVRIEPAALDVAAVDLRLRNAITALRREAVTVLVAPPDPMLLGALARGSARPPERVVVATLGSAGPHRVWRAAALEHAAGHRLTLDLEVDEAVSAGLPRDRAPHTLGCQRTIPAWAQLRPELQAIAREGCDALDGGAYAAVLACRRLGLDAEPAAARATPGGLLCVGADPRARVELAVALWRSLGHGARRPATRR